MVMIKCLDLEKKKEKNKRLKAAVAKADEDAMELGRLRSALDLARRALKNKQKSKEEAEDLAVVAEPPKL